MTREEILQAFDDINFVYNDCTKYDTLKRMLEELTERKRGEWKFYSRDEDAFDVYGNESWAIRYYCSNCNFMHAFIENHTAQYNFCPNCGARMKGAEDDKR